MMHLSKSFFKYFIFFPGIVSIFFVIIFTFCNRTDYDLGYTLESKEEVIKKTFEMLKEGDSAGIDKILLSREQHNTMFWRHVGEPYISDKGMTANDAYNWMNMETRIAERELISQLKGKNLSISKIECKRKPEIYGPFTLHLGCSLLVTDPESKSETITGIRSVLEYNGRFKLYHLRRE